MSLFNDINAEMLALAEDDDFGVAATLYPTVLGGGGDGSPLSVRGYFGSRKQRGPDGVITAAVLFTIPAQTDLTVTPKIDDRFTAELDGVTHSYRVAGVERLGIGAVAAGFTLTAESEGVV